MLFYFGKTDHPLFDLPVGPDRLNAIGSSLFYNFIDRQLGSTLSPLVCFECVFDGGDGSDSFKKSIEEKDHLLVFMNVDSSVVVQNIEAYSNYEV